MRRAAGVLLALLSGSLAADELVPICHGYGCQATAEIRYTEGQLAGIRRMLFAAKDAEGEREALSMALGEFYRWAGEQSDVHNDKGGNYADEGVSGRMDCIDHSTSTTRLLRLLERRGYLRWHRVIEPVERNVIGVLFIHYSAVIEEVGRPGGRLAKAEAAVANEGEEAVGESVGEPARFAVDSWFVDNGQPAVILPLEDWKKGAGPDV